jgi:hypothetical protein
VNVKVFLITVIGLALLEGVLSRRQATTNVGGVENAVVTLFQKAVDPSTPTFSTKGATK